MHGLVSEMKEFYSFLLDANKESSDRLLSQETLLQNMALQTAECGYFIQTYAETKSFSQLYHFHAEPEVLTFGIALRAVEGIFSQVDDTIEGYISSFKELKEKFIQRSTLNIQLKITRVIGAVQEIGMVNACSWFNLKLIYSHSCLSHSERYALC